MKSIELSADCICLRYDIYIAGDTLEDLGRNIATAKAEFPPHLTVHVQVTDDATGLSLRADTDATAESELAYSQGITAQINYEEEHSEW
jgi:hypothetical protein